MFLLVLVYPGSLDQRPCVCTIIIMTTTVSVCIDIAAEQAALLWACAAKR